MGNWIILLTIIYVLLLVGIVVVYGRVKLIISENDSMSRIPDEIKKKLTDCWLTSPDILSEIDLVIDNYRLNRSRLEIEEKQREIRIKQNRDLEATWLSSDNIPEATGVSVDDFKLWALLTHHYPMERGLLVERKLQMICSKMLTVLNDEEKKILFCIDKTTCDEAGEYCLAFDSLESADNQSE